MKKIFFLLASLYASTSYSMFTDKYGFPLPIHYCYEPVPMEKIRGCYNEHPWVTFKWNTNDLLIIKMYNCVSQEKNKLWLPRIIEGNGYHEMVLLKPDTPTQHRHFVTRIAITRADSLISSTTKEFEIESLESTYFIDPKEMTLSSDKNNVKSL